MKSYYSDLKLMTIPGAIMKIEGMIKEGYSLSEATLKIEKICRFDATQLEKYYIDYQNNE